MLTKADSDEVDVLELEIPSDREIPEVEVRGDEAVIRVDKPGIGTVEERKVKLPKTTWG